MTNKQIATYVVIGILVLTSAFSIFKLQGTQKSLDKANALNLKLNEENSKLLNANSEADKQLDELSQRYEVLNERLKELQADSENNQ